MKNDPSRQRAQVRVQSSPHCDERYLLQCGVVAFLIGFSFAGPYLLDGGL
jgi:hypothetical protein